MYTICIYIYIVLATRRTNMLMLQIHKFVFLHDELGFYIVIINQVKTLTIYQTTIPETLVTRPHRQNKNI